MVVEEKNGIVGTSRLMIMFSAKDMQLKQWTVTDPQGYDTTVAVYNLDTSRRPDPSMFKIDYTRYPTAPRIVIASCHSGRPLKGVTLSQFVMPLKITTWNINSVRLRIDLVAKFLKSARPDVLCLQETKCPDDAFPLKRFQRLGYEHAALSGQKGYHGVAVLSRLPFDATDVQSFCGKTDCRHVSVVLGERARLRDSVTLHNFYVPAGGDEPDSADQSEIPAQA